MESGCEDGYKITKYFTQIYVCYAFEAVNYIEYNLLDIRAALRYAGVFYEVTLNLSMLSRVREFRVLVHSLDGLPRGNVNFPAVVTTDKNTVTDLKGQTVRTYSNRFDLTYYRIDKYFEPPPYSTCINYTYLGYKSREHCIDDCLIDNVPAKLNNLLPFSPIYTDPFRQKLITARMTDDGNVSKILTEVQDGCETKCKAIDCFQSIFITSYRRDYFDPSVDGMTFTVFVKNKPDLTSSMIITNPFNIFLNAFLGVFGSWYDWDFMTLVSLFQVGLVICSQWNWI